MSAAAYRLAPVAPVEAEQAPHIEIVATRAQRRARPRAVYAAVTVLGLFAILIVQLLLSIMLSDGAYQISALQGSQKALAQDQQTLSEQLQVLESPQHLAANAAALGMVGNTSTVFLRLADGAVIGTPVAAQAGSGNVVGADGAPSIPDSLLAGIPVAPQAATGTTPGTTAQTPEAGSAAPHAPALPAPITR